MFSERASLKAAYCLKPKNILLQFLCAGDKRNMAAKGTFGSFFALEKGTRRPGAKAWMSPTAPFLSWAKEMGERTPWEPHTGFHIRTCRPQERL